ncbi:MAG: GIY-YIG nuclease family protein [Bacteroidia bacterium]|nr:GIY-YIG nuclease family protein [Bacteroidia bacterium]
MRDHNYFVYILTNKGRTATYVGVTNDLESRLIQHFEDSKIENTKRHAGKYNCYYLIYFERFPDINYAIEREKEIKKWRREKKDRLINSKNNYWTFLNHPEQGELDDEAIDKFLNDELNK